MCQDATDRTPNRPQNAAADGAGAQTWNKEKIYAHIAQALARGYTDLYCVNLETDAFIEYHTDDDRGVLTEARRGADFFEDCERDAKQSADLHRA